MSIAVLGSPPYAESLSASAGIDKEVRQRVALSLGKTQTQVTPADLAYAHQTTYGLSPGQLGALPPGTLDTPPAPTPPAPVTTWQGCYSDGWQDLIVPEAFAHPAKFARGLIHRIYRHLIERGYVRAGETVLDPFGGVGLGALDAMTYGLQWYGVELEPRFVDLGRENLELWRQRYGFHGGTLVQGDSRHLRDIMGWKSVQCVVSSPPFAESLCSGRLSEEMKAEMTTRGYKPSASGEHAVWGTTPGQLGAMPPGTVVSSPPYAGAGEVLGTHNGIDYSKAKEGGKVATPARQASGEGYGQAPGQLGNDDPCTFWAASAQVMAELAALLPPGAVCAWVLKAYVSKGKIVPFPQQWQALCEAHGFETREIIYASLIEDCGTQEGLFGEAEQITVARKSFFRRLYEKRPGASRIDYETVLILTRGRR